MTREFLQETFAKRTEPSVMGYIQSLQETLESLSPKTQTDQRRLEIAKENLFALKRKYSQLKKENTALKDKIKSLESQGTNQKEGE